MQKRHWISALIVSTALAVTGPACAKPSAVDPASVRMVEQGNSLLTQNKPTEAADLYEAALVADPGNAQAFIGLGRAYERLGQTGKAISYYRKALTINPNDLTALEASGMALIAKGSITKAQATLDKMRRLCRNGCAQADRLSAALSKAQAKTSAQSGKLAARRPVAAAAKPNAVKR